MIGMFHHTSCDSKLRLFFIQKILCNNMMFAYTPPLQKVSAMYQTPSPLKILSPSVGEVQIFSGGT